mgnify:CR=1 FL=1
MLRKHAQKLAELAPKIMSAFHDLGRQHPVDEKVSMRQFQALMILSVSESLTLSQLAEKLSLAPSTATELVNRMIALELIEKHEGEDKRQVNLSLTSKGVQLAKKRQRAMSEMFERFLQPFPKEARETFVKSFDTIWELIRTYHVNR